MMDHIKLSGERAFQLLGRKDGAVQIGGVNVYPDEIAGTIEGIKSVKHCSIFAKAIAGNTKLFCRIYLHTDTKEAQQHCLQQMRSLLPAVAFPADIIFCQA